MSGINERIDSFESEIKRLKHSTSRQVEDSYPSKDEAKKYYEEKRESLEWYKRECKENHSIPYADLAQYGASPAAWLQMEEEEVRRWGVLAGDLPPEKGENFHLSKLKRITRMPRIQGKTILTR
jgi:hypothetical protein